MNSIYQVTEEKIGVIANRQCSKGLKQIVLQLLPRSKRKEHPLGRGAKAAQRTLNPLIQVRILAPRLKIDSGK